MCDDNSEATARLLDTIGGTVFTAGDNAYFQGTRTDFARCYEPTWGRHRARTRPAPGNHDYETAGAVPYFEYFGLNAGPPGLGYYSFDVGAWHVVSLNSNVSVEEGSAQLAWLRADLRVANARCALAIWHHPLFSNGPSGPNPQVRAIWRALYDAGAEIVVNGHEHFYQRLVAMDPEGRADSPRGIRQFIVGTGGATLYPLPAPAFGTEAQTSQFGVLRLTLQVDAYQWQFVPVAGLGDSGTGTCH